MNIVNSKCKRFIMLMLLCFSVCLLACEPRDDDQPSGDFELNVMSFNMKFEKQSGGGDPIHTWKNRKPGIVKAITSDYQANIIGSQELEGWQHDELMSALGSSWSSVGLPRFLANDERCSIIYRNDIFEYIEGATKWLSTTPNVVGSKSWDTSLPRIVTYGHFKHLASGEEFYLFNTHLDHRSKEARTNGMQLIVDLINEVINDYHVVLTGDFNMYINDESFQSVTNNDFLRDSFDDFPELYSEHNKTTHGFNGGTEGKAIDFVFYSNHSLENTSTLIIHDRYENRYWLSDHYPVYSKLKLISQEPSN